MKKTLFILVFCINFFSCTTKTLDAKSLSKLNGYWEIQTVKLTDGTKKDYKVNETIDYFEINNNKGFRQKVMPQFNGKYATNGLKESIFITTSDDVFFINYITDYGKWKEEIVELQDSVLVLKSAENTEYHYKRQVPFSIK